MSEVGVKLPSYQRCEHCEADCAQLDYQMPGEPCWGEVTNLTMVGDPHYCEGHSTSVYTPSTDRRDKIVSAGK